MDLGRTVCEWVILQQHPKYRDTEAPKPKSVLNQQSSGGARALSPRRTIMMCLSVCVRQCLPFAATFFFLLFTLFQKHDELNCKHTAFLLEWTKMWTYKTCSKYVKAWGKAGGRSDWTKKRVARVKNGSEMLILKCQHSQITKTYFSNFHYRKY